MYWRGSCWRGSCYYCSCSVHPGSQSQVLPGAVTLNNWGPTAQISVGCCFVAEIAALNHLPAMRYRKLKGKAAEVCTCSPSSARREPWNPEGQGAGFGKGVPECRSLRTMRFLTAKYCPKSSSSSFALWRWRGLGHWAARCRWRKLRCLQGESWATQPVRTQISC